MLRKRLPLLFSLLLACLPDFARSEVGGLERPVFDAGTSFLFNSNVSNAETSPDREADGFWEAEIGSSWSLPVETGWRFSSRFFVGSQVPFTYSAFTMVGLGGQFEANYKAGLGPLAPRFSAGIRIEYDFFEEEIQSGWRYLPAVHFRKRLCRDLELDLFYQFDSRVAASELYDGDGHTGGLVLRWEPGQRWSFACSYQARYGDVVSYATPPKPALVEQAEIIVPGLLTFDRPLTGYRLRGLSHTVEAAAGYAITPDTSLLLTYRFRHTTRDSIQYDNHFVEFGITTLF